MQNIFQKINPTLSIKLLKSFNKTFFTTSVSNSSMELHAIISKLESFASTNLAESWDNVGLLVEPSSPHTVKKIFLTNDLTEPVIKEAIEKSSDLIISYHPPIFKSLKRFSQENWKDRIIVKAIENRIAIYSPHTSFDIVKDGVNEWLLSCFDGTVEPIVPKDENGDNGIGRICRFSKPMTFTQIVNTVKKHLKLEQLRLAYPLVNRERENLLHTIACCAGSGGSVLTGVSTDVYLTGELSHHEILDAVSNGKFVILCEHSNTERGYLPYFADKLKPMLTDDVEIVVSQSDRDPITIE